MPPLTIADTPAVEAAELRSVLPPALEDVHGGRRMQLGSLLVRDGLLSPEQLEEALAEKEHTGRRIGEIVVARGWVPAAGLARALAEQHHLEFIDLQKTRVEPAATNLLPEHYARRYEALPVEPPEQFVFRVFGRSQRFQGRVAGQRGRLLIGVAAQDQAVNMLDAEAAGDEFVRQIIE